MMRRLSDLFPEKNNVRWQSHEQWLISRRRTAWFEIKIVKFPNVVTTFFFIFNKCEYNVIIFHSMKFVEQLNFVVPFDNFFQVITKAWTLFRCDMF